MSSRRDWLLQQMGITQYRLRRPQALRGEIAVAVPPSARLLIVADAPPTSAEPLVADVLKSLALTPEQMFALTPDQLAMLSHPSDCPCWYLGVAMPDAAPLVSLSSPALDNLYDSASAKKALWQQICQHEHHFFTDVRGS